MDRQIQDHEKYEQELEEKLKEDPNASFAPCKNCKREIRRKMRRCPYCGILNPTVTVKEIVVTMVLMVVFMYALTIFFK